MFFIYNEGVASSGKPDLDVEIPVLPGQRRQAVHEAGDAVVQRDDLAGQFDLNLGHQVFVGQGIPVKDALQPGDYRLEIKVTDKTNSQTITRNVPFTVS